MTQAQEIGCYIHVPFCKAKCPYCDFYSLPGRAELRQAFAETTAARLEAAAAEGYRWRSLYLGGGTPSVLEPAQLALILQAARTALVPGAELTVECNPSSTSRALCETLARHGVNRVSLGLQTAVDAERKALGRRGGAEEVNRAVLLLRGAGIENISLDLMLGVPCQSVESLGESLRFCVQAGIKHVSAYLLKVEPGTPFAKKPPAGLADEELQCALYLAACEALDCAGLPQYEISSFASPGFEGRHNLQYWNAAEYFALGPGAHGFTGGRRWHYPRDLAAFLAGAPPVLDGDGGDLEEYALLRLRLVEGLRRDLLQVRFGCDIPAAWLRQAALLAAGGLCVCDAEGIRLTRQGFLLSNQVTGFLLNTAPQ
ncbi:MAG: radical SAM family heme chaperone HemW [Oscillospiraceae bacterium]|nr:radical SAM family heme chaperone HemW [Oscillospiraceae bacterium]